MIDDERHGHTWDPERYLTYADERGRPFVELLARVGADDAAHRRRPRLRARQPHRAARRPLARRRSVAGLDSQPGDDRRGPRATGDRHRLRGRRPARLAAGRPPVDVLVSNATLQWVPGHLDLLPRPGRPRSRPAAGSPSRCPATSTSPATPSARELAAEAPYAAHTGGVAVPASHDPATYLEALAAPRLRRSTPGRRRTSTSSRGDDPVFTWVSGTGARPTLQALPDDLRPAFEAEFKRRLRAAYPAAPVRRGAAVPPGLRGRRRCRHEAAPRPGRLPARRRGRRPRASTATALGLTEVEKPAGPARPRAAPGSARTPRTGRWLPRSTSASRSRSRRPARPTRRWCSTP